MHPGPARGKTRRAIVNGMAADAGLKDVRSVTMTQTWMALVSALCGNSSTHNLMH